MPSKHEDHITNSFYTIVIEKGEDGITQLKQELVESIPTQTVMMEVVQAVMVAEGASRCDEKCIGVEYRGFEQDHKACSKTPEVFAGLCTSCETF